MDKAQDKEEYLRNTAEENGISETVRQLGPWFHNLHLPDGTQTEPNHLLGDFPRLMWEQIAETIPADLAGWTVADIGCNAGFYSFEMRGVGQRCWRSITTIVTCDRRNGLGSSTD